MARVELLPCEIPPYGSYTCVDAARFLPYEVVYIGAIATIIIMLASIIYRWRKGDFRVYPQHVLMVPYAAWDRELLRSPVAAGTAFAYFIKALFTEVLTMSFYRCRYGDTPGERVAERGSKRAAKLLIVWGFIFAAIATIWAYISFHTATVNGEPCPQCIPVGVSALSHPARIFGVLSGIFFLAAFLLWWPNRQRSAMHHGLRYADYAIWVVLFIALTGFALQAALTTGDLLAIYLTSALHATTIIILFTFMFVTAFDHMVKWPIKLAWTRALEEYAAKKRESSRLPPKDIPVFNRTGKKLEPGW